MEIAETPNMDVYPTPVDRFDNTIIALTNPEDAIARLELGLKNNIINAKGEIVSVGKPLLNENGVSNIIASVRASINEISFLSDLDERDINNTMMRFSDSLIMELLANRQIYGVKDQVTCGKILDICQRMMQPALNRSKRGGERRFWKGTQAEHRIIQQNETSREKTGLNRFNPF